MYLHSWETKPWLVSLGVGLSVNLFLMALLSTGCKFDQLYVDDFSRQQQSRRHQLEFSKTSRTKILFLPPTLRQFHIQLFARPQPDIWIYNRCENNLDSRLLSPQVHLVPSSPECGTNSTYLELCGKIIRHLG